MTEREWMTASEEITKSEWMDKHLVYSFIFLLCCLSQIQSHQTNK
jgi:hypothetical protein